MEDSNRTPVSVDRLDHARLYALINSMIDGFLALDEKQIISLSNAAALEMLDANQVEGRPIAEVLKLVDSDGQPVHISNLISASGLISSKDWRITYKDGSSAYIFISIAPIRAGYGSGTSGGYVIIIRDITHERLLEEEKDEFISVVSHELRTPVTVAEGGISNSLLLAQREHLNPLIIKNLETAHGQAVFLSNMLNDLATLSRAEKGKMSLVVENFRVNDLLKSLVEDYKPQVLQKKITIECSLCEPDITLSSSRLYVGEILQNFITNSIKYTEKGGITLSARPAGSGVEFSVKDTGIGIGRNEHAKLFDKFFRSSDWRVKKIKGTGIGLYVTSKLTGLIDGKISFESELNRGSDFRLYAPNISPVVHAKKLGNENPVANT